MHFDKKLTVEDWFNFFNRAMTSKLFRRKVNLATYPDQQVKIVVRQDGLTATFWVKSYRAKGKVLEIELEQYFEDK